MQNKPKSELSGQSLGNSGASGEDRKPVDPQVNIDVEIEIEIEEKKP
jgi:hypothetical protein